MENSSQNFVMVQSDAVPGLRGCCTGFLNGLSFDTQNEAAVKAPAELKEFGGGARGIAYVDAGMVARNGRDLGMVGLHEGIHLKRSER